MRRLVYAARVVCVIVVHYKRLARISGESKILFFLFWLTIPVGQVQAVADALQARPTPKVPVAHALPVNDILAPALALHIGPIDKLVIHQVVAPLST